MLKKQEGSFSWSISRNNRVKLGWTLAPRFSICLHIRDYNLLQAVQRFFNGIGVLKTSGKFVYFDINSLKDFQILFAHLAMFPLMSTKRYMYFIFVRVFNIYAAKLHLTPQGFMQCVAYINMLNNSIKPQVLSALTTAFGALPQIILPPVPLFIQTLGSLSPHWIVGFVCCFLSSYAG